MSASTKSVIEEAALASFDALGYMVTGGASLVESYIVQRERGLLSASLKSETAQ